MSRSSTLTVRLPAEVNQKLAALAENTNRSRSFLAAEAIMTYVARESAIFDGIARGLRVR